MSKMWLDEYYHGSYWNISTRSNIKNYSNDIEHFFEWIKPWIKEGSGVRNMYAIVIYECDATPTIYYLDE